MTGFASMGQIIATIFDPYMHLEGAKDRRARLVLKARAFADDMNGADPSSLTTLLAEMKDICDAQIAAIALNEPPLPPKPGLVS